MCCAMHSRRIDQSRVGTAARFYAQANDQREPAIPGDTPTSRASGAALTVGSHVGITISCQPLMPLGSEDGARMDRAAVAVTLRPFEREDFKRLISWLPTSEALGQWCASFFAFPLDEDQLQRYL